MVVAERCVNTSPTQMPSSSFVVRVLLLITILITNIYLVVLVQNIWVTMQNNDPWLRSRVHHTCQPLYASLTDQDLPASVIAFDWISNNLPLPAHRQLCLAAAGRSRTLPIDGVCDTMAGFPFKAVCSQYSVSHFLQALCSCSKP